MAKDQSSGKLFGTLVTVGFGQRSGKSFGYFVDPISNEVLTRLSAPKGSFYARGTHQRNGPGSGPPVRFLLRMGSDSSRNVLKDQASLLYLLSFPAVLRLSRHLACFTPPFLLARASGS